MSQAQHSTQQPWRRPIFGRLACALLSLLVLLAALPSLPSRAAEHNPHNGGQFAAGIEHNAEREESPPSGGNSQGERPAAKYRTPQRIVPQSAALATASIVDSTAVISAGQAAPARHSGPLPRPLSGHYDPALGLHRGQAPPPVA